MALGATRGRVETLVFRQGFLSAAIGLTVGLVVSLASMRFLRTMLPGLDSANADHIWGEVGFKALTAVMGCWLPARRASKVDPNLALRQE